MSELNAASPPCSPAKLFDLAPGSPSDEVDFFCTWGQAFLPGRPDGDQKRHSFAAWEGGRPGKNAWPHACGSAYTDGGPCNWRDCHVTLILRFAHFDSGNGARGPGPG